MEQYDLLHRLVIATCIVALVMLVLWGLARVLDEAQGEVVGDMPPNAALLRLDKRALDEAYEEQIRHLFSVWLRGQARSDVEITNGIRVAQRAYTTAAQQIARREAQMPKEGADQPR